MEKFWHIIKVLAKYLIIVLITCIFNFGIVFYALSLPDEFSCNFPPSRLTLISHYTLISLAVILYVFLVWKYPTNTSKIAKLIIVSILLLLSFAIISGSENMGRRKGCFAVVKANLVNIKTGANTYYDTHKNYGSVASGTNGCDNGAMFTDKYIRENISSIKNLKNARMVCNSNGTEYAVSAGMLAQKQWWCIDSKGISKQIPNLLETQTSCPQ